MKLVVCTGGFDPLHSGHLSYLKAAKSLGDRLIVGVNSDAWLIRKKGQAFMPLSERLAIVGSLKDVDATMTFNDDDGTAISLLRELRESYSYATIIFANGGDRTAENIPEMVVKGIQFRFGTGGDNKANSSSWILNEYKAPKTTRSWGYYRVLHEVQGMKVKELTVNPSESLSMQRHAHRAEHWIVSSGQCQVDTDTNSYILRKHESTDIPLNSWHQLSNPYSEPCKIVEIQYGTNCIEEDIERK